MRLPYDYIRLYLGRHWVQWEEMHFPDLVEQAISATQTDRIEMEFADDLPPIRGDVWLQTAISYLMDPDPSLTRTDTRPIRVKADAVDASSVLVRIRPRVQPDIDDPEQPSFFPGTRLSVADQVIRMLDSQIRVYSPDEEIEFQFSLPVWRMPPDAPNLIELTGDSDGRQIDLMQGQNLVIKLTGVSSSHPWQIVDLNPQILTRASWSGKTQGEDLELHFRSFRTGLTPLRIEYHQAATSAATTFSIQVVVRPQSG